MGTSKSNRMRIIQGGMVISEVYRFLGVETHTGRVGNIPCFAAVKSIKGKSLRPRYMNGRPFTVQVLDDQGAVLATYGIATVDQVAAHPYGVPTSA